MVELIRTPETKLASKDEVLSFLNASSCKFIFRRLKGAKMNNWQERKVMREAGSMLYFVEYSKHKPEPTWIQVPEVRAFAPLFDPKGERVVYNTTFMPADIYVLPLDTFEQVYIGVGAHPHWWINPASGASYVIYRTENGFYTGFPPGKTMAQKLDTDNRPIGEPLEICPYGFGGGITPDGRYLATGYTHLIIADLETGEYLQPLGDRQLPEEANQVCDVSVSPDNSQRAMYLRITPKGEGRHDFFDVINFDGSNQTKIYKPFEVEEWQTPEWSTHPNFGTAVGTRPDKTYDIYIARVSDQELLRLTWDGGYGHVNLWIEPEV